MKQGAILIFISVVFLAEAMPQTSGESGELSGIHQSCPNFDQDYYMDGYCDDALNTAECGYDGGDCCTQKSENWNQYCEECSCTAEAFVCEAYQEAWFGDGECDASMNNPGCFYDGGDCCRQLAQGWDQNCQGEPDKCQCLDPFFVAPEVQTEIETEAPSQ